MSSHLITLRFLKIFFKLLVYNYQIPINHWIEFYKVGVYFLATKTNLASDNKFVIIEFGPYLNEYYLNS